MTWLIRYVDGGVHRTSDITEVNRILTLNRAVFEVRRDTSKASRTPATL